MEVSRILFVVLLGLLLSSACSGAKEPTMSEAHQATEDSEEPVLSVQPVDLELPERSPSTPPPLPSPPSHLHFVLQLCPYPEIDFPFAPICAELATERRRCLETMLLQQEVAFNESPEAEGWEDLDHLYREWGTVRCIFEDIKQWVTLETRTFLEGTMMERQELCKQRLFEDRLFLYASRQAGYEAFWPLVESRQEAGREAKRRLEEVLAAAEAPPVEVEEPTGWESTERWNTLVGTAQFSLEQPRRLAERHCYHWFRRPNCIEEVELYLHSIVEDAEDAGVCYSKRPSLSKITGDRKR